MGQRKLGQHDYGLLKNATRKLIQSLGGLEKAAGLTRVQKSALASYYEDDSTFFIPIDVVADLESEADDLPVTHALALAKGCYLQNVQKKHQINGENLPERLGEVSQDIGDVFRKIGLAVARDGKISMRLAGDCRGAIHESMSELAALEIAVNELAETE